MGPIREQGLKAQVRGSTRALRALALRGGEGSMQQATCPQGGSCPCRSRLLHGSPPAKA